MPTTLEDKFILLWRAQDDPDWDEHMTLVRKDEAGPGPWSDFVESKLIATTDDYPDYVITPQGRDLLATADAIGYDPSPADSDCPACAGKGEIEPGQTVEVVSVDTLLAGDRHRNGGSVFWGAVPFVIAKAHVITAGPFEWRLRLQGSEIGTVELLTVINDLVTTSRYVQMHGANEQIAQVTLHVPSDSHVQLRARLLPTECSTCSGSGRTATPPVEPAPCTVCSGTREVPLIGSFMEACPACKPKMLPSINFVFQGEATARSFDHVSDSIARTVAERIRSSNLATDPWAFRDPLPPFAAFDSRCFPKPRAVGLDLASTDLTKDLAIIDGMQRPWITGTDAITSFLAKALESEREIECQWEGGEALHIKDVLSVLSIGGSSHAMHTVHTVQSDGSYTHWYFGLEGTPNRDTPVITAIRYRTATGQSPDLPRKLTPGDSDLRLSSAGTPGMENCLTGRHDVGFKPSRTLEQIARLAWSSPSRAEFEAEYKKSLHMQATGLARRFVDRPTHPALQAPDKPAPPQIESRKPDPNPPGCGED